MSPDVANKGGNALVHYLEYGIREGRYPNNVYELWIQENRLTHADRKRIRDHIGSLSYRPTISLIVPVYNTDEKWLRRCLDSVRAQLYPDWELCIADDASTDPIVKGCLRIQGKRRPNQGGLSLKNGHISASSNSALEICDGRVHRPPGS